MFVNVLFLLMWFVCCFVEFLLFYFDILLYVVVFDDELDFVCSGVDLVIVYVLVYWLWVDDDVLMWEIVFLVCSFELFLYVLGYVCCLWLL